MRRRFAVALVLAPVVALGAAYGWSSSSSSFAVALVESGTATVGIDPFASCANRPDLEAVPSGWELWPDYDPCCGFFIPPSAALLPAATAWRECDSVSPVTTGCQQLDENWLPWPDHSSISPWIKGYVQTDGALTLQWTKAIGFGGSRKGMLRLIADADGPVHQAIFEAATLECTLGQSDLQDGRYLYRLFRGTVSGRGGGALAGMTTDLRPSVFLKYDDTVEHSFIAGLPGVLETTSLDELILHDWDKPAKTKGAGPASRAHDRVFFCCFGVMD